MPVIRPSIIQVPTPEQLRLYLLELPMDLPGYRYFLSSWLLEELTGPKRTFLIDVGPARTVPILVESLEYLGISKIDYLLLTHIHLDHAGGVGHFARRFPDTPVVVHSRGIKHLADPTRLWEASLKTLPEIAPEYGRLLPVDSEIILTPHEYPQGVKIIDTPGHAPHHLSFFFELGDANILFPGEAAGTYYGPEITQGIFKTKQPSPYLRPSTPPVYHYETGYNSLRKLMELNSSLICYCHFGYSDKPELLLQAHEKQLNTWHRIISDYNVDSNTKIRDVAKILFSNLLEADHMLNSFQELQETIKAREKYFFINSILGFLSGEKS